MSLDIVEKLLSELQTELRALRIAIAEGFTRIDTNAARQAERIARLEQADYALRDNIQRLTEMLRENQRELMELQSVKGQLRALWAVGLAGAGAGVKTVTDLIGITGN